MKRLLLIPLRPIVRAFYPRKYLQGRYFDKSSGGWYWAVRGLVTQKLLGINRAVPWPCGPRVVVSSPSNLEFHPDDLNNFQTFGCYFQCCHAKIVIGRGTYIAPNVGIITGNHDPKDLDRHLSGRQVTIGEGCWIGMNAVLLPGVELGNATIVGAGAVVTKSFTKGNCVVAGNPAKVIKELG